MNNITFIELKLKNIISKVKNLINKYIYILHLLINNKKYQGESEEKVREIFE
jgi:hypothetical protein